MGELVSTRTLIETASHVAVIVAIPFFFLQQNADRNSRREASSMEFIMLANDRYSDVISTLSKPWESVDIADLLKNNPTKEGVAQAKFAITESVLDSDIEKVGEFYKSVLICRRAKHCDQKLIDDFFRTNIVGFYCSYDVRLDRIASRLNRPDYATDLQAYAGRCA
ncbi:MAG: hypothetical protein K2W81_16070 [Sphingomonas sp.]|uniref:hypothetical protein n=1 Tax=Sphingomonas sp. TaxID=28214 RepID=UPI0025FB3C64|nr:hypothetical protein [Sphingomonas sp.]MBY0285461.1 hypothetical protein [Sphingomonas sp.]